MLYQGREPVPEAVRFPAAETATLRAVLGKA